MEYGAVELKFILDGGIERKYKLPATSEINDETMRGIIAGLIKLYVDDEDYPVLTDMDGRVFSVPSLSKVLAIEVRELKNGR